MTSSRKTISAKSSTLCWLFLLLHLPSCPFNSSGSTTYESVLLHCFKVLHYKISDAHKQAAQGFCEARSQRKARPLFLWSLSASGGLTLRCCFLFVVEEEFCLILGRGFKMSEFWEKLKFPDFRKERVRKRSKIRIFFFSSGTNPLP